MSGANVPLKVPPQHRSSCFSSQEKCSRTERRQAPVPALGEEVGEEVLELLGTVPLVPPELELQLMTEPPPPPHLNTGQDPHRHTPKFLSLMTSCLCQPEKIKVPPVNVLSRSL